MNSPKIFGGALLLSALGLLGACSKDDDGDNGGSSAGPQNRMSYTYAGTTQNPTAANVGAIWTAASKTLFITGAVPNQQLVSLQILNVTGPGTYTLVRQPASSPAQVNYAAFSLLSATGSPTATWQSENGAATPAPGQVVISKFDETKELVEGTFSFTAAPAVLGAGTATGTITVSGGSFGAYTFF